MIYNETMKQLGMILPILFLVLVCSCAPVLRQEIMDASIKEYSLSDMKKNPEAYEKNLFILGGIIIDTKATSEGSLIEALYVPVDSRGYLKNIGIFQTRFLALFPKESGFLDPIIFKRDREITCAGEFHGLSEGRIEEMEYTYPFFIIKELYLWAERREYYNWPYYYEPYPYWWDYPHQWYGSPYWGWRHRVPPPYWW